MVVVRGGFVVVARVDADAVVVTVTGGSVVDVTSEGGTVVSKAATVVEERVGEPGEAHPARSSQRGPEAPTGAPAG